MEFKLNVSASDISSSALLRTGGKGRPPNSFVCGPITNIATFNCLRANLRKCVQLRTSALHEDYEAYCAGLKVK